MTRLFRKFNLSRNIVLLAMSCCIGLSACNEEDDKELKDLIPITLSAPNVTDVGLYGATIEGSISYTEKELKNKGFGVVWSTTPQPEPVDSIQESWQNKMASTLIGNPFPVFDIAQNLELNTTYYTRSYFVYEDLSMVYSPEVAFTTLAGDAWHTHQEGQFPGLSRQFVSGVLVGGEFFAGLGFKDGSVGAITEWWSYDLNEQKWEEKASIPNEVGLHSRGFAIGEKGYMLSASENENPASFWEYDTSNNRWTKKADFPSLRRTYPMAVALNGKGYISGGLFFESNNMWQFDPLDTSNGLDEHGNPMGKWTEMASKEGGSIDRPTYFVLENQVYMYNAYIEVMPNGDRVERDEFWAYNPADDLWTQKADYPGTLDFQNAFTMVGFSIGNFGYVGGGENAEFWSYDPITDLWTQKNSAAPSGAEVSFSTDTHGYILSTFGGIIEYLP